jgi:hypothetical protein
MTRRRRLAPSTAVPHASIHARPPEVYPRMIRDVVETAIISTERQAALRVIVSSPSPGTPSGALTHPLAGPPPIQHP